MNNNRQTKHHPDTSITPYTPTTWPLRGPHHYAEGRGRENCFQSEDNLSKLHREFKGALSSNRKDHIREGNWEGCEDAFVLVNTIVRAVGLGQHSRPPAKGQQPPRTSMTIQPGRDKVWCMFSKPTEKPFQTQKETNYTTHPQKSKDFLDFPTVVHEPGL